MTGGGLSVILTRMTPHDDQTKTAKPYVRGKTFIDVRLQGQFVAVVMGSVGFATALMLVDYYRYYGHSVSSNLLDPSLLAAFLKINTALVIQLFFFLMVVGLLAVLLSHKIAGPLFNLKRAMRAVAEGDLAQRARFRKRDQMMDVKDEFNLMMKSVHTRVSADRSAVDAALRQLEAVLGRGGLTPDIVKKLEEARERLKGVTRDFKV